MATVNTTQPGNIANLDVGDVLSAWFGGDAPTVDDDAVIQHDDCVIEDGDLLAVLSLSLRDGAAGSLIATGNCTITLGGGAGLLGKLEYLNVTGASSLLIDGNAATTTNAIWVCDGPVHVTGNLTSGGSAATGIGLTVAVGGLLMVDGVCTGISDVSEGIQVLGVLICAGGIFAESGVSDGLANEGDVIGDCTGSGGSGGIVNRIAITGNCIGTSTGEYSNGIYNDGTIVGDCGGTSESIGIYNVNTITGDCGGTGADMGIYNAGTITGDCIGDGYTGIDNYGAITGNCTGTGWNGIDNYGGVITGSIYGSGENAGLYNYAGGTINLIGTLVAICTGAGQNLINGGLIQSVVPAAVEDVRSGVPRYTPNGELGTWGSDCDLVTIAGNIGTIKATAEAIHSKLPTGGALMHAAGAAVAKSPATLAAGDVTGNLPVDVKLIKTVDADTALSARVDASTTGGTVATNLDAKSSDILAAAVASQPTNHAATSSTDTTGTVIAGDYTNTVTINEGYWILAPVAAANEDDFGLDYILHYNVGLGRVPNALKVVAHFDAAPPAGDRAMEVWAYHYILGEWTKLTNNTTHFDHSTTDKTVVFISMTLGHVCPLLGDVQIRLTSTSTDTDDRAYIDQVLVSSVVSSVLTMTAEDVRVEMDANSTKLIAIATDVAGLDGEAMRGTENAYTGTPPTPEQIAAAVGAATPTNVTDAQVAVIAALPENFVAPDNASIAAILGQTGTTGVRLADAEDIYHADIFLTIDTPYQRDEYTVQWHKNGTPVTSGVAGPTIQVVKRLDGGDLVAEAAMTQIGSTGALKYDSTVRLTKGEAAVAVVRATIDGASRTWRKPVGRDL